MHTVEEKKVCMCMRTYAYAQIRTCKQADNLCRNMCMLASRTPKNNSFFLQAQIKKLTVKHLFIILPIIQSQIRSRDLKMDKQWGI